MVSGMGGILRFQEAPREVVSVNMKPAQHEQESYSGVQAGNSSGEQWEVGALGVRATACVRPVDPGASCLRTADAPSFPFPVNCLRKLGPSRLGTNLPPPQLGHPHLGLSLPRDSQPLKDARVQTAEGTESPCLGVRAALRYNSRSGAHPGSWLKGGRQPKPHLASTTLP